MPYAHKEDYNANARATYLKKANYIRAAKDVPCADCGESYPYYVMDFDHQRDKDFMLSQAPTKQVSWKRIDEEIAKCDVVCANCHRQRTYGAG